MTNPKGIALGHGDCLAILDNPSTQNILEKLGYEYSDRGLSAYRADRPNIVPALVAAIVRELNQHPVFPPQYREALPQVGVYIRRRGTEFILMDIDKPSVWQDHAFPTAEGAAHGYVRKILDDYWLKSDTAAPSAGRAEPTT